MNDEDTGKPVGQGFEIGQPLDSLSVEELDETIKLLQGEIERLQSAKTEKSTHLAAAAALFKS